MVPTTRRSFKNLEFKGVTINEYNQAVDALQKIVALTNYTNATIYYNSDIWELKYDDYKQPVLANRALQNCQIVVTGGHGLPEDSQPQKIVTPNNNIEYWTVPEAGGTLYFSDGEPNINARVYFSAEQPDKCKSEVLAVLGSLH